MVRDPLWSLPGHVSSVSARQLNPRLIRVYPPRHPSLSHFRMLWQRLFMIGFISLSFSANSLSAPLLTRAWTPHAYRYTYQRTFYITDTESNTIVHAVQMLWFTAFYLLFRGATSRVTYLASRSWVHSGSLPPECKVIQVVKSWTQLLQFFCQSFLLWYECSLDSESWTGTVSSARPLQKKSLWHISGASLTPGVGFAAGFGVLTHCNCL